MSAFKSHPAGALKRKTAGAKATGGPIIPKVKKPPVFDVSGIEDEHWRLTIASALRLVRSADEGKQAMQLTPSFLLVEAIDYMETLLPEEFWRLGARFDWSHDKRKGAIRITEATEGRLAVLMPRFEEQRLLTGKRQFVIVALYAYALHLQGQARLRAYGFVASSLSDALRQPEVFDKVSKSTKIDPRRLADFRNDSGALVGELAEGSAMIEATQIFEALGQRSLDVLHAATIASSEDEFRNLIAKAG